MAVSITSYFADWQYREGNIAGVVVKLTDGGRTWLLGDVECDLEEGHVHKVIKTFGGIKQSWDPIKGDWSKGTAKITFSNLPYCRASYSNLPPDTAITSGSYVRVSDQLQNAMGSYATHPAQIYFINNPTAPYLVQGAKVFDGVIQKIDDYKADSISITLEDKGAVLLEQNVLSSIMEDIAVTEDPVNEVAKDGIPLVYGYFNRESHGLARAVKHGVLASNYVVANHLCTGMDKLYGALGSNRPILLLSTYVSTLYIGDAILSMMGQSGVPDADGNGNHYYGQETYNLHSTLGTHPFNNNELINFKRKYPDYVGINSENAHDDYWKSSATIPVWDFGENEQTDHQVKGLIGWEIVDWEKLAEQFGSGSPDMKLFVKYQNLRTTRQDALEWYPQFWICADYANSNTNWTIFPWPDDNPISDYLHVGDATTFNHP